MSQRATDTFTLLTDISNYRSRCRLVRQSVFSFTLLTNIPNYRSHFRLLRESVFTSANGDRHGVPNVGIVITDGKSNEHEDDTIKQAELTRADGVTLVAIGITEEVDADELLGIAGAAELVVKVENFAQLSTYLKNIVSLACVMPIPTGRSLSNNHQHFPKSPACRLFPYRHIIHTPLYWFIHIVKAFVYLGASDCVK